VAVARANEFSKYVHPLLQAYCAKCHNEHYNGPYQLVQCRTRADHTADALRANLDATLRLIDPQNPSRSELLSSTLRPHGHRANKRPIFPGSNDRAYQVLATWVGHLRVVAPPGEPAAAAPPRAESDQSEVFARERHRGNPQGESTKIPPPSRIATGSDMIAQDPSRASASPQEFPLPFVISGAKPVLPALGDAPRAAPRPSVRPTPSDASFPQLPATRSDVVAKQDGDGPTTTSETTKPADQNAKTGAAKNPAKALKLDPRLLERVLQGRNAGQ
jgi:hypothetical protein